MIRDFNEGQHNEGVFLCVDVRRDITKKNKEYLSMVLQDGTGRIDAKVWDVNQGISLGVGDFIKCSYVIGSYNEKLQMTIKKYEITTVSNPEDYAIKSKYSVDEMWECLLTVLNNVENEWMKKLLKAVMDDEFTERFKKVPGARGVHHAFAGGLLQHTLFVTRICSNIAKFYGKAVNRDLLITSAFLHDFGKLYEIEGFPAYEFSKAGSMQDHIFLGAEKIDGLCQGITGFPDELRQNLIHCILAHHGELEFGSPVKPQLIEALILSHVDNLDAKAEIFIENLESGENTYNRYLGTITYRTGGDLYGG